MTKPGEDAVPKNIKNANTVTAAFIHPKMYDQSNRETGVFLSIYLSSNLR